MYRKMIFKYYRNGETKCAVCGAFCQGIKAPDGKILCSDCFSKYW